MATYTSNYAWTMPEGSDPVDITVLNNNLASQDSIVHNAYMQFAPVFSTSATYAVDDVVLYANNLYKCITAVTVAGDWDSTKWTQVKVSDIAGGGGGGTSDYSQLTNKPSINSVTLSGNKTSADLGLQDAIQLATMPTASATYVGDIVQFVGTTDANYTHGYFYECTTDGSTYSWTQTNVQPSSGGGTSDYSALTNKPSINNVTLSGNKTTADLHISYNDLENKPTIPSAQVNSDWNASSGVAQILNKPSLATVATSGSYTDLTTKLGIQNASGTSMTQRDALQFKGGLSVSDDSTNDRTVVSDEYELITWADWQTIVANHEENLHPNAIITGTPSADDNISVELMTKLWENPDPTSDWSDANVPVAISGYDFLIGLCKSATTSGAVLTTMLKAGANGKFETLVYDNGVKAVIRGIAYVDSNNINVQDCKYNGVTANNWLVPMAFYGIKTTASVKVSAIASDVSTSADKCMMADGASVEDNLKNAVPRTKTGTTLATLNTALQALSDEQKSRATVCVNGIYWMRRGLSAVFASSTYIGSSVMYQMQLQIGSTPHFYDISHNYTTNANTSTETAVTSWTLYYQGTPIS